MDFYPKVGWMGGWGGGGRGGRVPEENAENQSKYLSKQCNPSELYCE